MPSTWTISATTPSDSCAPSSASSSTAFGPPAPPGEPLTDRHRDVAFALQAVTEEIILHLVRGLLKKHAARDLCMTGGVALNCVANAKILEQTDVERLWVPPCASDTGAPLGSALVALPSDARPPARLRAEARALRQGLQRRRDRQGAGGGRPGLPAHVRRTSCCRAWRRTWPTARSSAGSRAASRWGRARSATARSWPIRAAPTCATSSTPRSRSASRSARSRPPCWSSARTSSSRSTSPTRS